MLETVELEPRGTTNASVIWLHGLGADGHDFEPIVPELALPESLQVRFVFPHAPVRPVTLNAGMAMRAWFDIISLERHTRRDEQGIRDSVAAVNTLVDREIARGIAAERIVLAGFSQGGVIALLCALWYPQRLAGVMGLSTYLPLDDAVRAAGTDGINRLPVFLAHGTYDPVLPLAFGVHGRDLLASLSLEPEWHEYPMPHAVCPEEIRDIRRWLLRVYGLDA